MILNNWTETLPSVDKKLAAIIMHPGSLTQYLQQCFRDITVKILEENDGLAEQDELTLLALSSQSQVKIRTIYLCSQTQPLVYARTVIPYATWFDEDLQLYQLGSVPLGKILFSKDHPATRGSFQFAMLSNEYFSKYSIPPEEKFFSSQTSLPARRSIFSWDERKLLVTEVFLPAFSDVAR